jgi:hypothetical protein
MTASGINPEAVFYSVRKKPQNFSKKVAPKNPVFAMVSGTPYERADCHFRAFGAYLRYKFTSRGGKEINGMKKISAITFGVIFALLFSLTGCKNKSDPVKVAWPGGDPGGDAEVTRKMSYPAYTDKDDTWAIYMYICGSNLESFEKGNPKDGYGMASFDITEAETAELPRNVSVVMEMGGAKNWLNSLDPAVLSRRLLTGDDKTELSPAPLSNMGDPNTLAEFLTFCNTEYPAEHQVVILWDHGGGSLFGYGSDELFDNDSLSLPELDAAFAAAPAASGKYEIIGFDACLMATIDVAAALRDDGNYLVASEEVESGQGWDYTGALNALAADTSQSAQQFAEAICDSFYRFYLDLNRENPKSILYQEATLSVVDLNRADALLDAYNAMADEALLLAVERREEYLSAFARAARASENYGYNTPEDGFFEMVDMGDLVDNAAELLPESRERVKSALADCVVYQVHGPMREKATGLSCYYCYSGKPKSVAFYSEAGGNKAACYYHEYSINGTLSPEGLQYLRQIGTENNQPAPEPQPLPPTENLGFADHPVTLGADGYWTLNLGADKAKSVAAVYNYMLWDNGTDDGGYGMQVLFGVSDEVDADRQNGVFTERFSGMWGSIDDAQVYMRPVSVGDNYILYSCPILLNGVPHSMFVSMERGVSGGKTYGVLGVRQIEDNVKSMSDKTVSAPKDMPQLQPGDVLEPVQFFMTREPGGDWRQDAFPVQSITIGENPRFTEKSLGDGHFTMMFCVVDYAGNMYLTQSGDYKVKEGKIERVNGWSVYPQPARTLKGLYLQKNTGANGVYYTAILSPGDFEANWRALGLPGSAPTYTIEVFTREVGVNLDDYAGERIVYLQGGITDGRLDSRNYDMVFEVTGIMAGEGGAGGENPSGTLTGAPQPDDNSAPVEIFTLEGGQLSASDREVLDLATETARILKARDWGALGAIVHPERGLTFSPWGFVDVERCVKLGAGDVKSPGFDGRVRTWGDYPSDEPINLSFAEYYNLFVFDRDYTNAAQIGVNCIVRSGGFENNLYVFGNGGAFAELHVPGTGADADYNWASLRLVFAWFDGDGAHESGLYLVGIVHDGWST